MKKIFLILGMIVSSFVFILFVLTFFAISDQKNSFANIIILVIAVVSLIIAIVCFKKYKQAYRAGYSDEEWNKMQNEKIEKNALKLREKTEKQIANEKIKEENRIQKEQKKQEKFEAETFDIKKVKHISGLPIHDGAIGDIHYDYNNLVFSYQNTKYSLESNKILGAVYKLEKELIGVSHSSSIGGAIGGALLLGPVGAIIGGRKTTHKDYKNAYVFAVSYSKDDEVKYFVFQTEQNIFKLSQLCKHIEKREKETVEIKI